MGVVKMRPKTLAVVLIILLLVPLPGALSAGELAQNLKPPTVYPGLGGKYRPGCAFPVAVVLEAQQTRAAGTIELTADTGSESVATYRTAYDITPGTSYLYFLYPHCSSGTDAYKLTIRDDRGRIIWEETPGMSFHNSESYMVGIIDSLPVPGLGQRKPAEKTVGLEAALIPKDFMPKKACGYGPVDVLVWPSPDPSGLESPQETALADWVRSGGRLVLATGAGWQGVDKSFLSELVPGKLTGVAEATDFAELDRIGGKQDSQDVPMLATVIENTSGELMLSSDTGPIVLRKRVGFGEVIFVAFDPCAKPFRGWRGGEDFWSWLFDLDRPERPSVQPDTQEYWGYTGEVTASAAVSRALGRFPKVRPISFAFVAMFLLVYVVLIGPVDYIVLKRLKRLEWTWFTFPTVALVATLVAFWAISASRTVRVYINEVAVEDWSADGKARRHASFVTLLSPRNRRYTVSYNTPGAGMNLLETDYRGSGGAGLVISQPFDMVDTVERGMTAADILIPVWSSRTFCGQWYSRDASKPPLEADLTFDGVRMKGTITNYGGVDIEDVIVVHASGVYRFGDIKPQQTVELSARRSRTLDRYCQDTVAARYDRHRSSPSRIDAANVASGATLLYDSRYFPGEYSLYTGEGNTAGARDPYMALDLPPGYSMRSLIEAGQALVMGLAEGASRPVDIGKENPERWERTLYRICVDIEEGL